MRRTAAACFILRYLRNQNIPGFTESGISVWYVRPAFAASKSRLIFSRSSASFSSLSAIPARAREAVCIPFLAMELRPWATAAS